MWVPGINGPLIRGARTFGIARGGQPAPQVKRCRRRLLEVTGIKRPPKSRFKVRGFARRIVWSRVIRGVSRSPSVPYPGHAVGH